MPVVSGEPYRPGVGVAHESERGSSWFSLYPFYSHIISTTILVLFRLRLAFRKPRAGNLYRQDNESILYRFIVLPRLHEPVWRDELVGPDLIGELQSPVRLLIWREQRLAVDLAEGFIRERYRRLTIRSFTDAKYDHYVCGAIELFHQLSDAVAIGHRVRLT